MKNIRKIILTIKTSKMNKIIKMKILKVNTKMKKKNTYKLKMKKKRMKT